MQFGSIHWELQARLLVTHVQWPIFLTGLELICDFYVYFLEEGRSSLAPQLLFFLLVVSVSHGDVSLGVPSCIGACTAPSLEALDFFLYQKADQFGIGLRNIPGCNLYNVKYSTSM